MDENNEANNKEGNHLNALALPLKTKYPTTSDIQFRQLIPEPLLCPDTCWLLACNAADDPSVGERRS